MSVFDVIGWAGTVVVLGSYFLAARGLADGMRTFHKGNMVGAPMIAASAVYHEAWPSLIVTLAFGVIASAALYDERVR